MFIRVGGPPFNWNDYRVWDVDKHILLSNVTEANDETGRYTIMIKNPETGQPLINTKGQPAVKVLQGNIKIVHKGEGQPTNSQRPAFTRDPSQ